MTSHAKGRFAAANVMFNSMCAVALVLGFSARPKPALAGGCEVWMPGPMFHQSEGMLGGVAPHVGATTFWDPPNGPPLLVIGGGFSSAGGVSANNIAAWDGASWRPLGLGVNSSVRALAVYNGDLIAGGFFTQAGGAPASLIARFDGTTWHPLGAGLIETATNFVDSCGALTIYNGELIAGGKFSQSGNTVLINIGRWNGSIWSPLGNPTPPNSGVGTLGTSDDVGGLRVHNNALYIGGWFQTAGGIAASNIVQYVNGTFSPLTSGTLGSAGTLHTFGADLVVSGAFIQAGGAPANHIARWNPASGTWAAFAGGLGDNDESVVALQPFNGLLVAGGNFPGTISAWNGSSWGGVGGGLSGGFNNSPNVFALDVFNSRLIAGGDFTFAGGASIPVNNIAQFDAATGSWSALHVPLPQVMAFETLGSRIIAGGTFTHSTTDLAPANNIIAWNGTTLSPITTGVNGSVRALKSFTTGTGINLTRRLIVGGDFSVAGGLSANRIAQWSEPSLIAPSWSAVGAGFNNSVFAIERFNNNTFAGGQFTLSSATSVNRIAQFNGTNWVALGSGMNGSVFALKTYNGFLYAGGDFTTAGGVSTGGLARWNGTSWSDVGGFFIGTVLAFEIHNNELVIGGAYPGLDAPNIAKYDGTNYSNLGTGGTNAPVVSLKSDGRHVYCVGGLTTAGGVSVNHVARWNATDGWSDVEGGTNEPAVALGAFQNQIHVGLGGTIVLAGGAAPQPGNGWVRFGATGTPLITQQPASQTVDCGENATFDVLLAPSFFTATVAWRKNGVPLNNGPTGDGSTISGANTAGLTISNVASGDAGAYDCIVTNTCGSTTSSVATLTVNECCAPDINSSGAVDVDDLLAVIGAWGACPAPPTLCLPDIAPPGGNGIVNVDDLLAIITGWGPCP